MSDLDRQEDIRKKVQKLHYLQKLLKPFHTNGEEAVQCTYYQHAGGGTRVEKAKLKKDSGPSNKYVMHVKVSKTDSGNKDYKISFSEKDKGTS